MGRISGLVRGDFLPCVYHLHVILVDPRKQLRAAQRDRDRDRDRDKGRGKASVRGRAASHGAALFYGTNREMAQLSSREAVQCWLTGTASQIAQSIPALRS